MWPCSRKADLGRRTTRPFRLASALLRAVDGLEARVGASPRAALEVQAEVGVEAEVEAVGRLVAGREVDRDVVGWVEDVHVAAEQRRLGRAFVAAGRVEDEVRPVDVDPQVPDLQRDPFQDVGDRIRGRAVDFDFGGLRVEGQRLADDDRAGVKGSGDRRGDRDHRERVAVVGAAEVELARDVGELAEPTPAAASVRPIAEPAGQHGSASSCGRSSPWRRRSPRRGICRSPPGCRPRPGAGPPRTWSCPVRRLL